MFAVDISRSMLAEDVAPNRLQRAVREARRLIQDLEGDRLGLIAFAGRSYILAPLTVDGGAIRMYLDALDPDLASEGGTNLARGAGAGRRSSSAPPPTRRTGCWCVFTDGEAHDTLTDIVAPGRGAQGRRASGYRGGGGRAPTPARIPIRDSAGTLLEYKQDEDGTVVRTQRRDDILRAVVEASEGTLVPSEVPDQAGAVRDLVAAMKRSPTSETRTADLVPRAWIPALVAALLLLAVHDRAPGAGAGRPGRPCSSPAPRGAQRPTAGERALAAGDPAAAAAAFPQGGGHGQRARDTAFYNAGTAALEAGRLDVARGALGEAAKSLDPGAPLPRALQPRSRRPARRRGRHRRGRRSSWTTRPTGCDRRCCCSRRPRAPSGTSSWPSGAVRRRRPAEAGAAAARRHRAAAGRQQPTAARPKRRSRVCRRARRSRSSTPWSGGSARRGTSSSAGSRQARPAE